jgi:hypothetical protein
MKHKNMPKWLILPVLFLLVAGLFFPCLTSADPATTVRVDPASNEVDIGETFTVDIFVDPDTGIAGAQFSLSFDPSLITANEVTEGNLLSQGGASTYFMAGTIDNVAGTITGVAGFITAPGEVVSQSGIFAIISFTTGTAVGTSALDLSNVIVGNLQAQAVDITVTDGEVIIGGATPAEYTITFDTDPEATGTITFDSVSYNDGNTVDKTTGTYAIAANPGSGYYFDSWVTTGGLSVTSSTSPTTTCMVSGAGTLRMVQTTTPPTEYTVTFDTDPAATGTITFDSVSYSDGNTVDKTAGTYAIVASPGSGYYFDSWVTTGGLSVTSSTSPTATCMVSSTGTLRMVQTTTPPVEYTITFDTDPAATGTITFAGVSYSDGNTLNKTAGTYNIVAVPGSGHYFDSWVTTGGLSVTSSTSNTTTCVVSSTGTLRMVQTTTAPPVDGTDHGTSRAGMVALWTVVGAAIIAGTILLVRRRRRGAIKL